MNKTGLSGDRGNVDPIMTLGWHHGAATGPSRDGDRTGLSNGLVRGRTGRTVLTKSTARGEEDEELRCRVNRWAVEYNSTGLCVRVNTGLVSLASLMNRTMSFG